MSPTFEISLNGKPLAKARLRDIGVLDTILLWHQYKGRVKGRTTLSLGGLDSITDKHPYWIEELELKVGDEVKMKITRNKRTDKPVKVKTWPKQSLKSKIAYFRRLEEELKDHL